LIPAQDGAPASLEGIVLDITDRKQSEADIAFRAYHDPLTGLPNRATLNDRLTQALARRRRAHRVLAVLFADLDRFKTVNDRLGHAVGDEVLRGVAARLAGALRPGDTVARLGGDEFIVLCEELSDPDDVVEIAQRLQAALAPPIVVHSEEILISASIGVVVAALQWPIDPAELLHEADLAMYRAKSRGCGRYEIVTGPGAAPGRDWSARIAALRDALDRDEIVVFYQPRVELPTLARTGAEALVRWRHPGRGLLGPDAFLTVADRSGLIDLLGRRVLRTACGDALAWPTSSTGRALSVSVNLSARQLFDPKIVDTVAKVLTDTALDPARLTLEMSEATVMARAEDSLRVLTDLKTLGVKLAIDDVGTGYSSLTYLKRFPLDEVMIDRSLIAGLGLDPAAAALASGVIGLAHALGLRAIAEGVETGAQRDVLVAHGCDYAQGFLWSPAVPAESLTRR
ncbi:MAG: putative bifunctional diguanylate cyclase/phosphodiesterase, partial [Frankiaceae bacterium]